MDGFKDFEHTCPNCNAIIGKSTPDDRGKEKKKAKTIVSVIFFGTVVLAVVVLCPVVLWVLIDVQPWL